MATPVLHIRASVKDRYHWLALAKARGFSSMSAYIRHLIQADAARPSQIHDPRQMRLEEEHARRPEQIKIGGAE